MPHLKTSETLKAPSDDDSRKENLRQTTSLVNSIRLVWRRPVEAGCLLHAQVLHVLGIVAGLGLRYGLSFFFLFFSRRVLLFCGLKAGPVAHGALVIGTSLSFYLGRVSRWNITPRNSWRSRYGLSHSYLGGTLPFLPFPRSVLT